LKDYIEERVLEVAKYIIDSKATIRRTAKMFGVSKSTVHKDITERLPRINPQIAKEAKDILDSVNVSNKPLSDGLNVFVDEIKKKEVASEGNKKDTDVIKENNEKDSKVIKDNDLPGESDKIVVYVENKRNNSEVNLKKFEEHASKSNLDVEITKNNDKNNSSNSNKGKKHNNGSNKKSDSKNGNNGKVTPPQNDNKPDKNKDDNTDSDQ
jgi:putative DeoR family transcriptional regulator (stage III sporulation protein D)